MEYAGCNLDSLPCDITYRYIGDYLTLNDAVSLGIVNNCCKSMIWDMPGFVLEILMNKNDGRHSLKKLTGFSGNCLGQVSDFSYRTEYARETNGKETICLLLRSFANVKNLNLSGCAYGDVLIESISSKKIESLNLSNTKVSIEALTPLLQRPGSIRSLNLSGLRIENDTLYAIQNKLEMEELFVNSDAISSEIIPILKNHFTGLRVLGIKFQERSNYIKLMNEVSAVKKFVFDWNAESHFHEISKLAAEKNVAAVINVKTRIQPRLINTERLNVIGSSNTRKRLIFEDNSNSQPEGNKRVRLFPPLANEGNEENMSLD